MTEIRNIIGKLVCKIDKERKRIEISIKGYITIICFDDKGNIRIINLPKAS